MREAGRVEIKPYFSLFRKVHPTFKVLRLYLVALDGRAAVVEIYRVKVEPLRSGNEREHLVDVGAKLFYGTREEYLKSEVGSYFLHEQKGGDIK